MSTDEPKGTEAGGGPPGTQDPPERMEEKMDKDFLFFLGFIPVTFKNIKDENEKRLCTEWLKRLTSKSSMTADGKRNRNIYLVNLILQMGDGKLSCPFTSKPPAEKLKLARYYFGGMDYMQPCNEDLTFDIEDFSEFSRDGRTYFATKALKDGRGAFAYVGVSTGGGDTVWVDAAGEPVCREKLKQSQEKNDEENVASDSIGRILKDRSSSPDRNGLITFYESLVYHLNEIIQQYGTENEPIDPVIEKMIEDLQMEAMVDGNMSSDSMSCFTRLHWLQTLKEKLEEKLNLAASRELELSSIEAEVSRKNEVVFLDLSNAIKPVRVDTMFDEAARDRPTQHNVELLKRHYPVCIVQKLLLLLAKEKFNVISQERKTYEDFVLELKTEIMNVARHGLEKYAMARKEWHRVAALMRRIEEERNKLLQEAERSSAIVDPDFQEKESILTEELARAKKKLEESKERNDRIDARIDDLHRQIHILAIEYEKMEERGKAENEQLAQQICVLQKEVKQQERKLAQLRSSLKEKREHGCNKCAH